MAGAWWRPGEWRRGASAGAPVPISVEAGLARELRRRRRRRDRLGRAGRAASPRAWRACARWSGRASSRTSSSSSPRARSTPRPRPSSDLARVDDPARRARLQRAVVEALPQRLRARPRAGPAGDRGGARQGRCWPSASWPSSAWPRARSCSPARWRRAATSACARAPCCGRSGATRGQLLRILLAEYVVLGALAAGDRDPALDGRRLGAGALPLRGLVRAPGARAARAPGGDRRAHDRRRTRGEHAGVAKAPARGASGRVRPSRGTSVRPVPGDLARHPEGPLSARARGAPLASASESLVAELERCSSG